jgi:hypothetical protein
VPVMGAGGTTVQIVKIHHTAYVYDMRIFQMLILPQYKVKKKGGEEARKKYNTR